MEPLSKCFFKVYGGKVLRILDAFCWYSLFLWITFSVFVPMLVLKMMETFPKQRHIIAIIWTAYKPLSQNIAYKRWILFCLCVSIAYTVLKNLDVLFPQNSIKELLLLKFFTLYQKSGKQVFLKNPSFSARRVILISNVQTVWLQNLTIGFRSLPNADIPINRFSLPD